jgi:SAM-dependent methyltransferase
MEESISSVHGSQDPIPHSIVGLPLRRVPSILLECAKGFWKRSGEKGLDLKEELVQEFFSHRSKEVFFDDFTDSTQEWYLSILNGSTILQSSIHSGRSPFVIDLGCGRCGLLRWLQNAPLSSHRYLGIDQDRYAIEYCQQRFHGLGDFKTGDVRDVRTLAAAQADLIFAVNLLPYIRDPEPVFAACQTIARGAHTLLIIVDPLPSVYWEREFGGFRIALRTGGEIMRIGEDAGWRLAETVHLAVTSLRKHTVLGLSQLLCFGRQ